MSTFFFILFFGFIAWRIINSVMGEGFDVGEEARKKLEALRQQAGQAQGQPQRRAAPHRTAAVRTSPAARGNTSQPRPPAPPRRSSPPPPTHEFDWYVVLDLPREASRREILDAAKRRLEVARAIGDPLAPARIARATATGLKQSGAAGARGRRQ